MAIHATVTLRDSLGRTTSKRLEHHNDSLTDAQTNMGDLAGYLNAITDLELVEVTYSLKDASDAFQGVAGSSIDAGATFTVDLVGGGKAAHKIPGFPISKAIAGGGIPIDDADVVNYFDEFLAAGPWRLSDGEAITGLVKGLMDK